MPVISAETDDQLATPGDTAADRNLVSDPFAVDLFAAGRVSGETPRSHRKVDFVQELDERHEESSEKLWHANLPRVDRHQVRLSAGLAATSPGLGSRCVSAAERTLADLFQFPAESISIRTVDTREEEFGQMLRRHAAITAAAPGLFISLVVNPRSSPVLIELETGFAAALVDRLLGGDDGEAHVAPRRELATVERAVIEFLLLSLVGRVNEAVDEPLLALSEVATSPPAQWSTAANTSKPGEAIRESPIERHLVVGMRLQLDTTIGYARIHLTSEALDSFSQTSNPLLADAATKQQWALTEKIKRFARIMPEASLFVVIGQTEIATEDINHLEPGDVVIVTGPEVRWTGSELVGELRVRAGDYGAVTIIGRQTNTADKAGSIKLAITDLACAHAPTEVERLKMNDERMIEDDPANSAAETVLDGLLLTVDILLATRRIRLDELARLRHGQLLDLGCLATDPVELTVDGRPIARGELVDIEGRLGVRITSGVR